MAAITILAAGAQGRSGAGAAVDTSAASTLRLDVSVVANQGHPNRPYLRLFIETGPSSSGPWTKLWEYYYNALDWPSPKRIVLNGVDAFTRARWAGAGQHETVKAYANPSEDPGLPNLGFVLGVAGDAI